MFNLSSAIKREARRLGFDLCRITSVGEAPHADFFAAWLAQGRAGEMGYLERNGEKRRQPGLLLAEAAESAHSLIVLAVNHHQFDLPPELRDDPSRGLIASYAWGDDYHEVIRPLLHELDAFIRSHSGRQTKGKALVDSGPVLERDWAQQAGIGFTGKNCCTIHPGAGSWLLLATLLVPEILAYDPPPQPSNTPLVSIDDLIEGLPPAQNYGSWLIPISDQSELRIPNCALGTCGRCTRCLDACPTDAFVGPYHLDPQRCISYWTIESSQPIPRALRPHFGNRIFGCDICQEVCPWNRRLPPRTPLLAALHARQERIAPPLLEGFDPANPYWLDPTAFRTHFRRSPIVRAKRHGLLRNVCVALGNWADPVAIAPLILALNDPEPLPRGHAAWALGEIGRRHDDSKARQVLSNMLNAESEPWVREEILLALSPRNSAPDPAY